MSVRRVPFDKLASLDGGESSAMTRARVETARAVQAGRFSGLGKANMLVNGDMGPAARHFRAAAPRRTIQTFCRLDAQGKELMRAAVRQIELSARSYHRVLKLARTIADLPGEAEVQTSHLAGALLYRPRGVEQDWIRYNHADCPAD